ncbi:MAG: PAS domain S-box protein, partial [Sedimentisphaerales bacterium]|nr:PAS domain S-box protein [Sedimentisphaerales bacterium]
TEHSKIFTTDSWHTLSAELAETASIGKPYELELETVKKDGGRGWMWVYGKPVYNSDGKIVGIFGAAQDITERKLAEQKIYELNAQLEQKVQERTEELRIKNETLEQTVARLKDAQGQLVLFEKMTVLRHLVSGIAHEINNPLGAIDSSRELLEVSIKKLITNINSLSQWLNEPEGHLLAELIKDADSGVEKNIAISSKDKRKARARVVEVLTANGIENAYEIGELLVVLNACERLEYYLPLLKHHDVMNRLHMISGIYDVYSACCTIKTAVNKSSRIVNALRSYVRKESEWDEKISASVKDGLENVLVLYQNTFKNFVTLELDIDSDLPMIMCYPDQLNQVWTNIIQNAIYAMNNTGKLTIEVKKHQGGVIVRVIDEGCGMPPEVKERIFEPLFTTKPAGEGIGLGMDIVRMIVVERHNGRIDIESEPGKGTTVSVWLPAN